mmetsp:Transcript_10056/g.18971  ORF Transcript_10056/g.18971 Transcript_10056/m.18971 type:complete len:202 (+) Transcript_10056:569-1174(+)
MLELGLLQLPWFRCKRRVLHTKSDRGAEEVWPEHMQQQCGFRVPGQAQGNGRDRRILSWGRKCVRVRNGVCHQLQHDSHPCWEELFDHKRRVQPQKHRRWCETERSIGQSLQAQQHGPPGVHPSARDRGGAPADSQAMEENPHYRGGDLQHGGGDGQAEGDHGIEEEIQSLLVSRRGAQHWSAREDGQGGLRAARGEPQGG